MPRTARTNVFGTVYHVIHRFADHRWFLRDDDEREAYLRMLGHALAETDWRCLAYALMSSHIHLAMVAGRLHMQSWTRAVNAPFARWLNHRHGRIGSVFASRAKDYGFVSSRTGSLLAYLHNNPVRAGVVERARDTTWTSHRAYLGLDVTPSWLHVEEGLRRSGFQDPERFDAWIDETPGERCDLDLEQLRRKARLRGDIARGSTSALPPGALRARRPPDVRTPTADGDQAMIPLVAGSCAHIRPDPLQLIEMVANVTSVDVRLICSRRRLPAIRSAKTAVVKAGLAAGLTQSELGAALGISSQAVHQIAQRELSDMERRVIEIVTEQLDLDRWARRRSLAPHAPRTPRDLARSAGAT